MNMVRAFFNFFTNDPILLFAAPAFFLIRIYHNRKYTNRAKEIREYRHVYWADSLIVASFSFISFYIIFGLSSPLHPLPAYAFLIPGIIIYAKVFITKNEEKKSLWQTSLPSPVRKTFIVVLLLLLCNASLTGINLLMRQKYIPFNMSEIIEMALPKMNQILQNKKDDEKIYFFASIPIDRFILQQDDIDISRFNFVNLNFILDPHHYEDDSIEEPHRGDFILITPYDFKKYHEPIKNIRDKYSVIFLHKSLSKYYFKLPTLRVLVKLMLKMPPDDVDFYLYQVKQ